VRLAEELVAAGGEPVTFALEREASYRALHVDTDLRGARFTVRAPDGRIELATPLRGRFNVYNVLGALAAVRALGVPMETAAAAIELAGQVPGRFETVDAGQPFAVVVDYAHTPDSLDNVLSSARELVTAPGARLHVVFGAGGDRDRGKRPMMGRIARRLADRVIVTSDNPRSEDPEAIIAEILSGSGPHIEHNADRREAIELALSTATPGDVVVIAGKGHEQGQEFADGLKLPFDDVTVARELLDVQSGQS
jgi:UDP-N-acetylmuramoyl-L-alanyl-D-glutamate--2,6-diaminopimelate ligase